MCYIKKNLFILFSQTNVWLYWECDMRMKGDLSKINTHTLNCFGFQWKFGVHVWWSSK